VREPAFGDSRFELCHLFNDGELRFVALNAPGGDSSGITLCDEARHQSSIIGFGVGAAGWNYICGSKKASDVQNKRGAIGGFASDMQKAMWRKQVFASLTKRRKCVASNAYAAMRIRNIGMMLNPSPCQTPASAQHDAAIRGRTTSP
jgi:hypothetical protein